MYSAFVLLLAESDRKGVCPTSRAFQQSDVSADILEGVMCVYPTADSLVGVDPELWDRGLKAHWKFTRLYFGSFFFKVHAKQASLKRCGGRGVLTFRMPNSNRKTVDRESPKGWSIVLTGGID